MNGQNLRAGAAGRAGGLDDGRYRVLVEGARDHAIFMIDAEGRVATWNAGATLCTGYAAPEIIGARFSKLFPPNALEHGLPERELEMAQREGSFEDEGWRVRKDGSLFWANVVVAALRGESGELLGYAAVARDVTRRRGHEEALRRSEERLRLLIEGVSEYAIFMLDPNGNVATWNVGAQRIKGYAAGDVVGKHFSIFYPQQVKDGGWCDHELREAADKGSFVDDGWRLRKDGSRFWANVTITALRDGEGRLLGFAKLTRDMTDSKKAEAMETASKEREELLVAEREARMAAQRAARAKDEFLSTLSHELRTPLSAILGWTQILTRDTDPATPQQRHAIEVIDRNARAQAKLIDDLLDLSRIMAGKVRFELQQVSMADVTQAALESALPVAEAKDIRARVLFDQGRMVVNGDPSRLQQIVWNLLTNAVKFTPKGGRVEVLLRRVNSYIELSVTDTGVGIPESFLPLVFDRFSQRDGSTTRAAGGLGLGLAISKQLAELHGGTIKASSPGEGMGSTFRLELPISLSLAQEGPERAHPAAEAPHPEPCTLPDLTGARILAVDDEPDARELLSRIFEGRGARVAVAASAEEALEMFRTSTPDLVVSDIGMPGMDGYQLMRALRASEPPGQRVPALALTAFARAEDLKRSLLAGFQAHLAKPFDVSELVLMAAGMVGR